MTASTAVDDAPTMMRAIAQASPDALITIDRDGLIVEFSPAAEDIYGYSRDEALGQPVADIVIPPGLRSAHDQGMRHYNATGHGPVINKRIEVTSVRRNGDEFPAELTVIPFMHNQQRYFTAFVRDISARIAHEQELQAARQAAEAVNEAKGRFLALVSHELRTPLNVVIGALDLLREQGQVAPDMVGIASDSGQQLVAMVDQILDLSELGGELKAAPEDVVSIAALADELHGQLRRRFTRQAGRLRIVMDTLSEDTWIMDARRLRLVLWQLIENAIKHTEGDVELRIEQHNRAPDNTALSFRVLDCGDGLGGVGLEHAAQLFAKAEAGASAPTGGLGLGLALAGQLVSAMGGELKTQLIDGQHHAMSFTLVVNAAPGARSEQRCEAFGKDTSLRVLVVDDVAPNQMIARAMLERDGHQVVCASDGEEAVQQAGKEVFDVILMDLRMPRMDGLTAARAIRKAATAGAEVPIIAMTANAGESDRQACRDAGMNDFLAKPVNADALRGALRAVCRGGLRA